MSVKANNVVRGKANTLKELHGYSAYEIAVIHGFEGTEEEWLESLKGEDGKQGIQGEQGLQGEKGDKGDTGDKGADGGGSLSASTTENLLGIGNLSKWSIERQLTDEGDYIGHYAGAVDLSNENLNGVSGALVQLATDSFYSAWTDFKYSENVSLGNKFQFKITPFIKTNGYYSGTQIFEDSFVDVKLGNFSIRLFRWVNDMYDRETQEYKSDNFYKLRVGICLDDQLAAYSAVVTTPESDYITTDICDGKPVSTELGKAKSQLINYMRSFCLDQYGSMYGEHSTTTFTDNDGFQDLTVAYNNETIQILNVNNEPLQFYTFLPNEQGSIVEVPLTTAGCQDESGIIDFQKVVELSEKLGLSLPIPTFNDIEIKVRCYHDRAAALYHPLALMRFEITKNNSPSVVDQSYNPKSRNAQSGIAIAGVIADLTNRFANAIELQRTERAVTLDNCSPIDANFNIKARNKNLIPFPYETPFSALEDAGLTVIDNGDGSFVLNGTSTKSISFILASHLMLEAYTNYYLTSVADMSQYNGVGTLLVVNDEYASSFGVQGTCFTDKSLEYIVFLDISNGETFNNVLYTPQIELGNKQTKFVPYCKAEDITVSTKGKNLVCFEPHTENDKGLNIIYGEDGMVTLIGTKESDELDYEGKPFTPSVTIDVPLDPEKTYYASIKPHRENYSNSTFIMIDEYEDMAFQNCYVIIKNKDSVRLQIKPQSNELYRESDNIKFELKVIMGTTEDAFEKGVETQLILNEDGTVENEDAIDLSVAPTITAYPEGAVMDISYNADIKKYIDEKIAEISAQIV